LAVTFTHLLPEVGAHDFGVENDYPLGYLIVLMSYLGLVMIEKVIFPHKHNPIDYDATDEESLQSTDSRLLPPPSLKGNLVTPIMLLVALCIHSIFEGLIFGLQETDERTLSIMIAILSHKPIETLFLGIVMVKEYVELSTHIIIITVLSVITPLGICIGMALHDIESTAIATFSAIASGTFLYIATTEIIGEEFHNCKSDSERWKKFLSLCVGLAFVFVLRIWVGEHEHDNEPDHDH